MLLYLLIVNITTEVFRLLVKLYKWPVQSPPMLNQICMHACIVGTKNHFISVITILDFLPLNKAYKQDQTFSLYTALLANHMSRELWNPTVTQQTCESTRTEPTSFDFYLLKL